MQTIAVNRNSVLARRSGHFFTKIDIILPHEGSIKHNSEYVKDTAGLKQRNTKKQSASIIGTTELYDLWKVPPGVSNFTVQEPEYHLDRRFLTTVFLFSNTPLT